MNHLTVMQIVASALNIPYEDYTSTDRTKEVSQMKTIAAMKMRQLSTIGVSDITKMYGLKNHTTIVKNCQKGYKRLRQKEEPFSSNYSKCSIAIIVHANTTT